MNHIYANTIQLIIAYIGIEPKPPNGSRIWAPNHFVIQEKQHQPWVSHICRMKVTSSFAFCDFLDFPKF